LEDERLAAFMFKDHPRFYQLAEIYGSPLDIVKIDQKANLQSNSAKVSLVSEAPATQGKTLNKKILLSMTVAQLKAMCSKLFKIEVMEQTLVYIEEGYDQEFPFDEEQRQLSIYSIRDGGKIIVRQT